MSPNATLRHAKEADDRDLDTSGLARWPTAIDQQSAGACSNRFVGLLTVPTVGSRAVLRAIATSVPGRLQPVIHPACRHSPQRLLSASASVPVRPEAAVGLVTPDQPFAEGNRSQVHVFRQRGQQVTWNSPIFGFLHSLTVWIASGVGAARTRHFISLKKAAASGDSVALPY